MKKLKQYILIAYEYLYDMFFYARNYSHSRTTANKIGYNMALITHSLEKGMGNKNPRRFGKEKTKELIALIKKFEKNNGSQTDFNYIAAINILREYVAFYRSHFSIEYAECQAVIDFLADYNNIPSLATNCETISKDDILSEAQIDYQKFLRSRHSIREFDKKPIQEKDLQRAVEIATLSPSACNRQMCKVYYPTQASQQKAIIDTAQGFGGFVRKTITPIIVTFDVNANYFAGEHNQGWFNAGLFSMNLVNALHSLGIGSCFCQFANPPHEEKTLKKLLNIPKNERIAVIIAIGYYPKENRVLKSPRKNVNEILRILK